MDARPVDERDTQWESRVLPLRVVWTDGQVEAYDLRVATLDEARRWAERESHGRYEIWLRSFNELGQPGLHLLATSEGR